MSDKPQPVRLMKNFGVIAVLVFIAMVLGNFAVDLIPLSIDNPIIESIVGWLIIMVPIFLILRTKMARKALAE